MTAALALANPTGGSAALSVVALTASGAALAQVVLLARARGRPLLLVAWMAVSVLNAAAWLTAAARPEHPGWSMLAIGMFWVVQNTCGISVFWARVPIRALASLRIVVDVATVGAAGAGLWVMARVPDRLADGTVVADRQAAIVFGVLATMTLAFGAVVGGHQAASITSRLNAALGGLAGLVWADSWLRGGAAPAVWTALVVVTAVFGVVLFAAHLPGPDDGAQRRRRPGELGDANGRVEPSPMIAGIVESVLWVLIIVFQWDRPIELAVVLAACTAAAAISVRSMARWVEQTRTVRSLQRIASTDPLTGLPNRRGFARAMETCRPGALALIDLDGFKRVNDRLGHAAGDELLEAVAAEGRRHLGPGATFARLGGDEFGLVVPGGTADAVHVAEEIVAAIATLRVAGHVTASAGVAEIGSDVEATLRSAGYALHGAKRAGQGRTMQLSGEMVDLELRRAQLAEALAGDLERGNLGVVYQPIVRVATGEVIGAEALVRWTHPVHREVSPEEFIPLAEELGLIGAVGDLVLDEVIRQVSAWQAEGLHVDVAVNVSGLQLRGPDSARRYIDRVAAAGVRGRVSIEVTESAIVDDEALETLEFLRASGFRCAVDDFGTGYASISGFMRMRPDRLKIDRRFVSDLGTPAGASAELLVDAVVRIAHDFGVEVVAEGVESAAALEVLAAIGCDGAQGFHVGRPGSADDLRRCLERGGVSA